MPTDPVAERAKQRDIDSLSFEEALSELEGIVRRLEQGSAKLEESIFAYQRGEALRKHCEKLLAKAQGEVEKITANANNDKAGDTTNDKAGDKPNDTAGADQSFSRQKLSSV